MLSEREKKKVAEAARVCFREIGIEEMTLEDVARESGIPVRKIKATYPDINALITTLMSGGIDAVTALLEKSITARSKADVKLSRFVKALLTDYEVHAPLFKLVSINFETLDNEDRLLRNLLTKEQIDRYRRNTVIIGRLIAEGQSEGIFRKADPLECAYFLRGIIHGAIRYWSATNYEGRLADFADIVMRLFLTGVYK